MHLERAEEDVHFSRNELLVLTYHLSDSKHYEYLGRACQLGSSGSAPLTGSTHHVTYRGIDV